jgi:SpoVK/Ycf46/Vps4 family AAA+-type ATPase
LTSTDFEDAEPVMRNIFDLATHWGAIILIDEADVFMSKRSVDDGYRSGLVAIFLRILEYHEGIVFLTSNKQDDLDEAFESRLHLRLYYPLLDQDKKERIWRTALAHIPETQSWTTEEFEELASELDVNGRQISNLVRTAAAVARYKKLPLSKKMLIDVQNINSSHITSS